MRVAKFTHSCLRLEGDGVLVVDPGTFRERSVLSGADAVLVRQTHLYQPADSLVAPGTTLD